MDRFLEALHARFSAAGEAFRKLVGARTRLVLKLAALGAVLAYIAGRLTEIGWRDVLAEAPTTPVFYLCALGVFFALPLAETLTYRIAGGGSVPGGLRIFIRKRILNESVLSYSGEAYLYPALVASGRFDGPGALGAIKDVNLLSAFISNTMTIVFTAGLVALGQGRILQAVYDGAPLPITIFLIVFFAVYAGGALAFPRISSLPSAKLAGIAATQIGRFGAVAALQILQWSSALPGVALTTWISFVALQLLVKRIPFLPNGEIMFLGVGLGLIGVADAQATRLAAVLLTATATSQALQAAGFLATIGAGRRR